MKKYSLLILILSFFLGSSTFQLNIQEIRVCAYENPPKIYFATDGSIQGFWPTLVDAIAENENWQITWVKGTWEECLAKLEQNEIDMMVDVGVTEERKQIFTFSEETVLISWARVYERDESSIQTILDLSGKKIAGLTGALNFDGPEGIKALAEKFGVTATFIGMERYEYVFEALQNGEVDAGVTNKDFGDVNADQFGLTKTPIIIQPTQLTFAYPKNGERTALIAERIDENIRRMKADKNSVYYEALEQYFAVNTEGLVVETIPPWVIRSAIILAGVVLFLLAVSWTSRMQVFRQTKKLKESESRYKTLTQVTPVGIFSTNIQGNTTFVNETWCQITGVTQEEALGTGWMKAVHPDDREFLQEDWKRATSQHENAVADYRFIHEDGSVIWVFGQAVPEYNPGGELIGYVGTITDITERKKVEELTAAVTKAETADKLKSAFLATMSHELRTPLNSIIGFTGILLQKLVGPLSEEQEKQLKMVQSSAFHLLNLINDVLDISKIEADQVTFNFEDFEINQVITHCVEKIQPLAQTKGLRIKLRIEHGPLTINSDQRRVEQILLNLLNNAVKFTDSGEIILKSQIQGNYLLVSVVDTGIGISPENLKTLFTPFKQVESGISRKYEGTGLGLSISKRIVDLLGGSIGVESEPGNGSNFFFTLPLDRGANYE